MDTQNTVIWVGILLSAAQVLFTWFLFSLGLRKILKKLHWKNVWMAWIPGARFFALGNALEHTIDGILCGVLDVLNLAISLINVDATSQGWSVAIMLLHFVVYIALFVFRIRLFMRILRVFERKNYWIVFFLLLESLTILILGFGKKYQPKAEFLQKAEAEQAAEERAEAESKAIVPDSETTDTIPKTGLYVNIRERKVREFGKTHHLLRDIAMTVPNGSMVLLLGGSGAGKTTFVNAVIGYEKADAKIVLNGRDVYHDGADMKYRIGFVPQQNLMRGNDTVLYTVDDAAEMRLPKSVKTKDRIERVNEVLALLGLSSGSEGLVSKKSGGQLRRIAIAMELVSDPELFVLDEPDSGLDGIIAREIFQKLRTIADDGKIVIVITHTPDRVIDLFDRVIILGKDSQRTGRLTFYGTPDEAKAFFHKDTMEGILMSINQKEEGGEGLAEHYAELFAATRKGGAAE